MNSRREEVWVGAFVLIAAIVLIGVVLAVSGAFRKEGKEYRAYFKYAAGLAPAAPVRYGGLLAGKIESLRVDPGDSTRIELRVKVNESIPVKTDSLAKITTLGPLGESYLEITTGTKDSPLAPPGSVLKSREMVPIAELGDMIGDVVPSADRVLATLNDRLGELKLTIANVNDLLNDQNRKNISSTVSNLNGLLAENGPKLTATMSSVQESTAKLPAIMTNVHAATDRIDPLINQLSATMKQANETLAKVDSMLAENRPDIRAVMVDVRKTLSTATEMIDQIKNTADRNSDNLDSTLVNVRDATENLKEMSDTLKRNPSVLVRGEIGKDRRPGDKN